MMVELPLGFALLGGAILAHVALWRITLPTNHTLGLLAVFGVAPVAIAALIGVARPSWLPTEATAWLRLALLYVPCALAYIVCYSAIEQESATLALAVRLAAAGEQGMTRESLRENLGREDIPGKRLASMVASGMVRLDGGGYVLTGKGRVLARLFGLAERLAGLPRGG